MYFFSKKNFYWKEGKSGLKSGRECCQKCNFTWPFFVQLNSCSSVTNEALMILQWASTKRHPRGYLCVWDSYITSFTTHNSTILSTWLINTCVYITPCLSTPVVSTPMIFPDKNLVRKITPRWKVFEFFTSSTILHNLVYRGENIELLIVRSEFLSLPRWVLILPCDITQSLVCGSVSLGSQQSR